MVGRSSSGFNRFARFGTTGKEASFRVNGLNAEVTLKRIG